MATVGNITEIITGQVEEFAAYPEEWLRFLLSPCTRNYRLRFDEKVMLYHENPEAEMVATYEQWQRIGYQVLRGSRGIPVLSGERNVRQVVAQVEGIVADVFQAFRQHDGPQSLAVAERLEAEALQVL